MDHKVSKDMISSGMIPSGEKTQADLGRIQYGSAPSPSSLMDAYKSMYEHHQKDENGNTIPHEDEDIKEENLDEINAGYSTDAGLASTANMKPTTPVKKRETGRERLYRLGRGPRPKSLGPTKAQQIRKKLIGSGTARNPETSLSDIRAKQKQQVRTNALARNVEFRAKRRKPPGEMKSNFAGGVSGKGKATDDFSSQYKSTAGTSTNIKKPVSSNTSALNVSATKRQMGRAAAKRRSMMNDVDLFDLIKGAFIEEGYNESDALAFMVETSPEYLAELDREATMLGLAATSAIPFVAKKLFGKKVDKTIQQQRKTSPIGGDNRAKKIEKAAGAEGFFK